MIARISVPRHNDIGGICYRVLARSTSCDAGDDVIADLASASVNHRFRVRLATADLSQGWGGKHGKKGTSDEGKQSKQNA